MLSCWKSYSPEDELVCALSGGVERQRELEGIATAALAQAHLAAMQAHDRASDSQAQPQSGILDHVRRNIWLEDALGQLRRDQRPRVLHLDRGHVADAAQSHDDLALLRIAKRIAQQLAQRQIHPATVELTNQRRLRCLQPQRMLATADGVERDDMLDHRDEVGALAHQAELAAHAIGGVEIYRDELLHALDLVEHLGQRLIIARAPAFFADAPLHQLQLSFER